jgi:hypothetical protein
VSATVGYVFGKSTFTFNLRTSLPKINDQFITYYGDTLYLKLFQIHLQRYQIYDPYII